MYRLEDRSEGLYFGLRELLRAARAHEQHVQFAFCKPNRLKSGVVLFMVAANILGVMEFIILILEVELLA